MVLVFSRARRLVAQWIPHPLRNTVRQALEQTELRHLAENRRHFHALGSACSWLCCGLNQHLLRQGSTAGSCYRPVALRPWMRSTDGRVLRQTPNPGQTAGGGLAWCGSCCRLGRPLPAALRRSCASSSTAHLQASWSTRRAALLDSRHGTFPLTLWLSPRRRAVRCTSVVRSVARFFLGGTLPAWGRRLVDCGCGPSLGQAAIAAVSARWRTPPRLQAGDNAEGLLRRDGFAHEPHRDLRSVCRGAIKYSYDRSMF